MIVPSGPNSEPTAAPAACRTSVATRRYSGKRKAKAMRRRHHGDSVAVATAAPAWAWMKRGATRGVEGRRPDREPEPRGVEGRRPDREPEPGGAESRRPATHPDTTTAACL